VSITWIVFVVLHFLDYLNFFQSKTTHPGGWMFACECEQAVYSEPLCQATALRENN